MVLFIIIGFKYGIGVGLYPIESFSFKCYLPNNKNFVQITFGVYIYGDTLTLEKRFGSRISIRGARQLSQRTTNYYSYSQHIGVGVGLHFKRYIFPIEGEIFYEFNLLPNLKDFSISIAPNLIALIHNKKISINFGGGGHYYIR